MKNIIKFIFLSLSFLLIFQSCRDDADRNWTSATPSFTLYNTTLSANVLYPTMDNNPFRLAWANSTGSTGTYKVQLSTTANFASPVDLGTSTTNTYTTTIGALNAAILKAGVTAFGSQPVFIRIVDGTKVSNNISFVVTPYASVAPVITAPTAGTALVLDGKNPDVKATTITWTDAKYSVDVVYLIQVAKAGTTVYENLATVNNALTLDVTNKMFNDAVLKLGLVPGTAANVDIKITSTVKSAGGTITNMSAPVTVKVTPFVAFKNLYLVGDATAAGWNPNNNNQALFRDPSNANKFYFTGKFGTSAFKLLEKLGQWQPQWGLNNGVVAVNDGTGSDPDVFPVSTAGNYTFTVDILAKTYSFVPFTGNASTTYATLGIIGSATEFGWGGDTLMEQSTFDKHQWSLKDISLVAGEMKFRADGSWNTNWGSNTALSGLATSGGPNIPIEAGTYDIFFNDLDGRYQLIKK